MTTVTTLPVPLADADLPWVDLEGDAYLSNPGDVLDAARRRSPVVRTVRGYEVIAYDTIRRMVLDPKLDSTGADFYRDAGGSDAIVEYALNGMLPMIQNPRHDRIRKVLQRGFTLPRINGLRPVMRAVANRLIDRCLGREMTDLVADFSHRYPLEVLCALIGVPEADVAQFGAWTVELGRLAQFPLEPHVPHIDAALTGLYAYCKGLIAKRRTEPRDDFVSDMIAAQVDGERLSEAELLGALVNFLFAGHDTTRYQLAWVIQLLMENRDQWDRLRAEPSLASGAVEEALRLQPSLHVFLRRVIEDVTYGAVILPAGTSLILNSFAANRDPAMFPDPERFDTGRANANRHLTFSYGTHLCLGQALARAEMAEALQLFVSRFPDMRAAGDPDIAGGLSFMRGAERLPISLNG
jgi:cytochrome P450